MTFGSSLRAMVKKELSSDQNWKEAFWETALPWVNATHRVTSFSSAISLLTKFSGNLQWDTSYRNEAYCDYLNNLRWKLERSFIRNFLVMCEFISQRCTYVSWRNPLNCLWGTWEGPPWIPLRPTLINEFSSVQNMKETFWETSFWSASSSHRLIT